MQQIGIEHLAVGRALATGIAQHDDRRQGRIGKTVFAPGAGIEFFDHGPGIEALAVQEAMNSGFRMGRHAQEGGFAIDVGRCKDFVLSGDTRSKVNDVFQFARPFLLRTGAVEPIACVWINADGGLRRGGRDVLQVGGIAIPVQNPPRDQQAEPLCDRGAALAEQDDRLQHVLAEMDAEPAAAAAQDVGDVLRFHRFQGDRDRAGGVVLLVEHRRPNAAVACRNEHGCGGAGIAQGAQQVRQAVFQCVVAHAVEVVDQDKQPLRGDRRKGAQGALDVLR